MAERPQESKIPQAVEGQVTFFSWQSATGTRRAFEEFVDRTNAFLNSVIGLFVTGEVRFGWQDFAAQYGVEVLVIKALVMRFTTTGGGIFPTSVERLVHHHPRFDQPQSSAWLGDDVSLLPATRADVVH